MEISNNLFFLPFPVNELKNRFRNKRKVFKTLQNIVLSYYKDNSEGVEILISYFDKIYNNKQEKISPEEEKDFKDELDNLDQSFTIVFTEFYKLDWTEQRDIYVKFYNYTKKVYIAIIDALFKEYRKVNHDLSSSDLLFYNYLKLITNLYSEAVTLLQTSHKSNFKKNLEITAHTTLYFSIPMYHYTTGKINEHDLLDRMGELGTIITSYKHPVHKNVE